MTDLKEYSETYRLSANEADAQRELALTVLVSKLIDIATTHANLLHIGNPDMKDINAGWVLSRLTIEMDHFPSGTELYSITTWVESWNRFFSERAFRIDDQEGNAIGHARSVWMVINTDTHENAGLSHLSLPAEMISGKECPIARQAKHREIAPSTHGDPLYTFKYCDIDFYRHVNTVKYITLLLNQYSLEEFDRMRVRRFEISFLHEARYGMMVEIRSTSADDSTRAFALCDHNAENAKPMIYARISLMPRNDGQ